MRRRALLALFALPGCAVDPSAAFGPVRLPRDAVEGAGDPTRAAVNRAAFALAEPARLAGRPGEAARVIADMEYLAVWLPQAPDYQQRDSLLQGRLLLARAEWRQALGIAPAQPAQPLIDGLYAVWRASQVPGGGSPLAALPPGLLSAEGVARLEALPPLPESARAAAAAARVQFDGQIPSRRRL